MSLSRAACAAQVGRSRFLLGLMAVVLVALPAGFLLSCGGGGGGGGKSGPNHNAYVTLPADGSVLLLHINGSTGAITKGAQTPSVQGTSPTGLALLPSKKFLYAVNSFNNTISIFKVASDGTLTLTGTPTPVRSGPNAAVIDPSGSFLLVTNNFDDSVSVFSVDSSSGALTETAGSPVPANSNPTAIIFTHSGKFVYVTNPGIGMVTGFSFANGVLTQLPTSPVSSGQDGGAAALTVDGTDHFLYVANPSASNPPPFASTVGNLTGFSIDQDTGELKSILGSPFAATNGKNPSAITVDPSGRFVYAVTPGSSFSIWCFQITPENGQLTPVTNSPFSQAGGEIFALIDPSGNYFYIGSEASKGIAGYTYDPSTGVPTVITGSPFSTGVAPGGFVLSE